MKIALIGLTYPFRGGISHYTTLLYRELKKDHQVEFISLKKQYPEFLFPGKTQLDESGEKMLAENHPLIHPLLPWTWCSALLRIRSFSPDLTLFQWWHPFFAPAFGTLALGMKILSRTKIVYLCHNVRPHKPTLLDTALIWYAFQTPDYFIVHAESDLKILMALKPRARVFRTPHPTYEIFGAGKRTDSLRAKRALGVEGNLVLFFGYVKRYKGLEYLLQAFPKVLRETPCTLIIAGEVYEDKPQIQQMIEQFHLAERVRLIDRYIPNEQVALYFNAADVVVLPYVSATQSGIIQVAYGFRKPVISTRVGGIPEVIRDGETGFLIEPKDPEALSEAILRFFRDRESIDFAQNIEKLQERFAWKRMVEIIENIYKTS